MMFFIGFRLEETLIDLYLSGYNQVATADDGAMTTLGTDEGEKFKVSADGWLHFLCTSFYWNLIAVIISNRHKLFYIIWMQEIVS